MFKSLSGLVLQIVLVVAGVIIFCFFDPFGLLAPKKKTLQDTPVSVVSIKEIGQLITAEYYGEVLSSLQGELIEELIIDQNNFGKTVENLNKKYIKALKLFYVDKDSIKLKIRKLRKKKDLKEYFYATNPSLVNDPFYQDMIKNILFKNKKDYDSEGELLKDISKMRDTSSIRTKFGIDSKAIVTAKQKELENLTQKKAFKKRQIIALGRGWVRAGIDFKNFNEHNFKYDKEAKIIYLFGIEPQILNSDINPWFNAKEKIKGFEIIAATNKANDAEYLKTVKESCLAKLIANATNAGIIKQAEANAEETLKNFFSLLLDEKLEKVVIIKTSLTEYQKNLIDNATAVLPKERLQQIDSTLAYLQNIFADTMANTILSLEKKKFIFEGDAFSLNRFSALACRIAEDKLITTDEWKELNQVLKSRTFTKLDSLWFFPYKNQVSIVKDAKSKARVLSNYEATGLRYWADSVTSKTNYTKYQKKTDSLRATLVHKEMTTKKNNAIAESVGLMEKYVETIIAENQTTNEATQIRILLSQLKK